MMKRAYRQPLVVECVPCDLILRYCPRQGTFDLIDIDNAPLRPTFDFPDLT
jgi:hypothetical protein